VINAVESELEENSLEISCLKEMKEVIQLTTALFSRHHSRETLFPFLSYDTQGYSEWVSRERGISQYLSLSLAPIVNREIQSIKLSSSPPSDTYLDHLFSLLTGKQISEAIDLAVSHGDMKLALLIAQIGSRNLNRELKAQLEEWNTGGAAQYFSPKRKAIYNLLAGNLHTLNLRKMEWKRCLGLHLWFTSPTLDPSSSNRFSQLLSAYTKSIDEDVCCPPFPSFLHGLPLSISSRKAKFEALADGTLIFPSKGEMWIRSPLKTSWELVSNPSEAKKSQIVPSQVSKYC